MADDEVKVSNNVAASRFEAHLAGQVAFAEYRLTGAGVVMPHTEVPDAFSGKGVGGKLAEAALDWIRGRGEKVIPTCPFISAWIKRHPEYQDLVHADHRARLGLD